ncbi:MAG: ATP-binding protein [Candidatus Stygibacter frigidus]|nr:ATP-binding protein [Candidatus Stygibacter frigidus]
MKENNKDTKQILSEIDEIMLANPSESLSQMENLLKDMEKFETVFNLEFIDNGPFIPDDVLQNIFDQFFSTKDKRNNSGLVLTLARKIIEEKFHGEIKCYI